MEDTKKEVERWQKRIEVSVSVRKAWEKKYRVEDCYNYWTGDQRKQTEDAQGDRMAIHNKIFPDVAERIPTLYFHNPYGRVIAAPSRSDTPGETMSAKARLLQDTGIYMVQDPEVGFRDNTDMALLEAHWAMGCVEVGYSPNFIDNPAADKPELQEKKPEAGETGYGMIEPPEPALGGIPMGDMGNPMEMGGLPPSPLGEPLTDEMGLGVDEGSDLGSIEAELRRVQETLSGESFYVKHIDANHILISGSNRAILEQNDWVGYWEVYPLEDVKRCIAYSNTDDLKASPSRQPESGKQGKDAGDTKVDEVVLYRIWDLRTREKLVLAEGHDKVLLRIPFKRCALKFLRFSMDPYKFFPIPPVFLKLASQDKYNDSAEYLRKMQVSTVPRYTYDEEAIMPAEAEKLMSRDMNIMIPRKDGTRNPIEPVVQPSTGAIASQTLMLSEKEFAQADKAMGDPLNPATQTATRLLTANAKSESQDDFQRVKVAKWLGSIIEELILLAVDFMSMPRWIAINVDLDSLYAEVAAQEVQMVYGQIDAERLRDQVAGIKWHIEVEAASLSPLSEAQRGEKLMQIVTFLSNPATAALMANTPGLLKLLLRLGGVTVGEDVDAVTNALKTIVMMNQMAMMAGKPGPPGVSPQAGSQPGPQLATPGPPQPNPVPPGMAG